MDRELPKGMSEFSEEDSCMGCTEEEDDDREEHSVESFDTTDKSCLQNMREALLTISDILERGYYEGVHPQDDRRLLREIHKLAVDMVMAASAAMYREESKEELKNREKERRDVEQLVDLRRRLKEATSSADAVRHELQEEKDHHSCQICFENPQNVVVPACMHFLYCSYCLFALRQKGGCCPTCRGRILGVCEVVS